jgi:DNA-binding CsgD family transcriptional regulator
MSALLDAGFVDSGLPLASKSGMAGAGQDLLMALMDELAYGVLVIGLDGRVIHANLAARNELERPCGLSLNGEVLHAPLADDARTLQDALAKAAEGKRSLISLLGGGTCLTLAVVPLRGEAGVPARVALFFARAAVYESLMLCFFARSHGLTNTEEHVLGILCQGYSTPDIARQMKVAVSTVRSHVRSMCGKTRSSGVRELVNRVAVLPPVAPAMRHDQVH